MSEGSKLDIDAAYFRLGKMLLGEKAGGQLLELLRAGDVSEVGKAASISWKALAWASLKLLAASRKDDPRAFVAKILQATRKPKEKNGALRPEYWMRPETFRLYDEARSSGRHAEAMDIYKRASEARNAL